MMAQHTTEGLIILPCLAVGWALTTIARKLIAPLAALVLTLLRWKPKPPLAYVLDCSTGQTCPTWDPALVARLESANRQQYIQMVGRVHREHAAFDGLTYHKHSMALYSKQVLAVTSRPVLDKIAKKLGIDETRIVSLDRHNLIAAILNAADDATNDYSGEVPTAAERSPTLLEGMP